MAFLVYEVVGSEGERIAEDAADATGIAIGIDEELNSVTFDSDAHDEEGLRTVVDEAMRVVDSDWESHLQRVD